MTVTGTATHPLYSQTEEMLFAPLRRRLLRDISRLGQVNDTEDIVHEAIIVGLRRLRDGTLQEPDKLAGFLSGTARNIILANRRRDARRKTTCDSPTLDQHPCDAKEADELLNDDEQSRHLRLLLRRLSSPRDSSILQRFYLDEEDQAAICRDLELTDRQFTRLLYRARQRLKKLL